MTRNKKMKERKTISRRKRKTFNCTLMKHRTTDHKVPESLSVSGEDDTVSVELKQEHEPIIHQNDTMVTISREKSSGNSQSRNDICSSTTRAETFSDISQTHSAIYTFPGTETDNDCLQMMPALKEKSKFILLSPQQRKRIIESKKPIEVYAQLYPSDMFPLKDPTQLTLNAPLSISKLLSQNVHDDKINSDTSNGETKKTKEEESSSLVAKDLPQVKQVVKQCANSITNTIANTKNGLTLPPPNITHSTPNVSCTNTSSTMLLLPSNGSLSSQSLGASSGPSFPNNTKSSKLCRSLPLSWGSQTRRKSISNCPRPPAFGEVSPKSGIFARKRRGSLPNCPRPPAFGETSPKPQSFSDRPSTVSPQTSMSRPPFGTKPS